MHIFSLICSVARTSLTKAKLVEYISTVQRWNLHYHAHQSWSFPFHQNLRGSNEQTNLQSWWLENPFQCGAQVSNSSGSTFAPRTENHKHPVQPPLDPNQPALQHWGSHDSCKKKLISRLPCPTPRHLWGSLGPVRNDLARESPIQSKHPDNETHRITY